MARHDALTGSPHWRGLTEALACATHLAMDRAKRDGCGTCRFFEPATDVAPPGRVGSASALQNTVAARGGC